MTQITMQEVRGMHTIEISGHAGYGVSGADIVCAAISTLGYTLLNELALLETRGLVENLEHKEENGYLKICFRGSGIEVESVCETIKTGFLMLEKNFFSNVRVRGEK